MFDLYRFCDGQHVTMVTFVYNQSASRFIKVIYLQYLLKGQTVQQILS